MQDRPIVLLDLSARRADIFLTQLNLIPVVYPIPVLWFMWDFTSEHSAVESRTGSGGRGRNELRPSRLGH